MTANTCGNVPLQLAFAGASHPLSKKHWVTRVALSGVDGAGDGSRSLDRPIEGISLMEQFAIDVYDGSDLGIGHEGMPERSL